MRRFTFSTAAALSLRMFPEIRDPLWHHASARMLISYFDAVRIGVGLRTINFGTSWRNQE